MADINNRTNVGDANKSGMRSSNFGTPVGSTRAESFTSTPPRSTIDSSSDVSSASSSYREYIDKGREFINRNMANARPMIDKASTQVKSHVEANPWYAIGATACLCVGLGFLLGRALSSTSVPVTRVFEGDSASAGDEMDPSF